MDGIVNDVMLFCEGKYIMRVFPFENRTPFCDSKYGLDESTVMDLSVLQSKANHPS